MSHEIMETDHMVATENMVPWHGLGTTLPNKALDSKEALTYSKLAGWGLTKQPVYAGNAEDGFTPIPEKFAVTRGIDNSVLGVVGDLYTIVHNEEAFDWMDNLLGGEGFHYKTAGSLRNGRIVWLLAKAPFQIDLPDSPVDMFVLLTNCHDGSGSVQAVVTPVRVVCANTLRAALGGKAAHYKIRHTVNAAGKLREAQEVLGLAKGARERIEAEAKRLRKIKLTDADFAAFLDKLIPVPMDEGRGRTIGKERQAAIKTIYTTAEDQQSIKGTAWGAWNAVVAFNDHHINSRGGEDGSAAENRMIRVMLKDSERLLPQKAFSLFK